MAKVIFFAIALYKKNCPRRNNTDINKENSENLQIRCPTSFEIKQLMHV